MIDRQDFDGKISVLDPNDVETILLGDRLYILLLKEHLKKLEKSPRELTMRWDVVGFILGYLTIRLVALPLALALQGIVATWKQKVMSSQLGLFDSTNIGPR